MRERHLENVHDQLSQRGGNALAHAIHRCEHFDHAIVHDADVDVFFQRVAPRPFQERGDALAAPQTLARGLGRALLKAGPVGLLQSLVHHRLECARVIRLPHRVLVGHLRGLNEVAPPQRDAVDAALACRLIHQTLDVEDRLGAARTTIGAGGGRVGEHRGVVEIDVLDVVDAGLHPRANQHLDGNARHAGIGADIGMGADAQAQYLALLVECHFSVAFDVAAVCAGEKFLAAVGDPLDRALQPVGTVSGDHVLGVGAGFHAKASAHIADHDAYLLGGQTDDVAHHGANPGGHLTAHANRQATLVHVGEHAARFDREGRHTLVVNVELDHVLGLGKGLVHGSCVPVAGFGAAVVGGTAQQGRIGGERVLYRDCAGQFLVVDHHRFSGIAGQLLGVGHDRHHWLAHKAHAVHCQRATRRCGSGRAVRAHEVGQRWHVLETGGAPLRAGQHQMHAGHGLGGGGVNRANVGVRVGRAQKCQPALPVQHHIVGILAVTSQQLFVFQTAHGLPAAKTQVGGVHGGSSLWGGVGAKRAV